MGDAATFDDLLQDARDDVNEALTIFREAARKFVPSQESGNHASSDDASSR